MRLKQLLILFLLSTTAAVFAQETVQDSSAVHIHVDSLERDVADPADMVEDFIHDLADPSIPADVVLSQYVLVTESNDEMLDYLIASLEEVRINLVSKNLPDINLINYHELPRKETADIDPEGKNVDNMFFLKHRNRHVVAVYVDQGKIASFTLVSKGRNMAHFVTY